MKKIIRIDVVKVIDNYDIQSFDLMPDGNISSRGISTEDHIEKTLVLFNRFKFKLPRWV